MTQHNRDDDNTASEGTSDAGSIPEIPEHILELDYVFQSVAHSRRRYLLYTLESKTEWSLTDLATKIAAWEMETPEDDVPQDKIIGCSPRSIMPTSQNWLTNGYSSSM